MRMLRLVSIIQINSRHWPHNVSRKRKLPRMYINRLAREVVSLLIQARRQLNAYKAGDLEM